MGCPDEPTRVRADVRRVRCQPTGTDLWYSTAARAEEQIRVQAIAAARPITTWNVAYWKLSVFRTRLIGITIAAERLLQVCKVHRISRPGRCRGSGPAGQRQAGLWPSGVRIYWDRCRERSVRDLRSA